MRALWFAVAISACGYPALPDIGSDAMPTQVNGTALSHWVTDNTVIDSPRDLSSGWTFTTITNDAGKLTRGTDVKGNADGTFVVPIAGGATSWYLEIAHTGSAPLFLYGNAGAVDIGYDELGRKDKALVSSPTSVTINATGLSPWQSDDDLQIMSSNAGALWFGPQYYFPSYPTNGTSTLNGQTFQWTNAPLVDSSKGDVTVLTQLVTTTSNYTYAAVARMGIASGFTQTNGGSSTMNVSLNPVSASKTLTIHWKRSQFAALMAEAGPGATFWYDYANIDALPQASTRGFYASAPDLVEFYSAPTGSTDIDQTFTYGNPFNTPVATPWDEFVPYGTLCQVPVQLGTAQPTNVRCGAFGSLAASAVRSNGNIVPAISGVRALTIGGKDITKSMQTGVGLTPTIAWMAPAIGTSTGYEIEIDVLSMSGGNTTTSVVAYLDTKDTSLVVPDQVLAQGSTYILITRAYANPGTDYTARPHEGTFPAATFESVSAPFTP